MVCPRLERATVPFLLIATFAGASLEPQPARADAREREQLAALTRAMVESIRKRPAASTRVLKRYSRIEATGSFDRAGRYALHRKLLGALRGSRDPSLLRVARSTLRLSPKTNLAAQVLVLKALVAPDFPGSREERIELLVRQAKGSSSRLQVWGLRLLGDSRWPEAVDAMIRLLDHEEASGRSGSFLWHLTSGELHRVLGSRQAHGIAATLRARWEKMGRKVPKKPDHGAPRGVTVGFFGDKVSPRSVFVIDTSSSMRQLATLPGSGGRIVVKGDEKARLRGRREPKVEIVKRELERAVAVLQPIFKFNILSYSATFHPWKGSGKLRLHPATRENVASGRDFARTLTTDSGTNIYDSLEAAMSIPDVDTVYLLSDGQPSRGGTKPQIEANARLGNYLLGIRIVTYGFTPEGKGSFDEEFMKRLARSHRGWYRRLNGG
ncbi:MAG: hypothetical protein O7J95_09765 [Planctomycetota bacterium]|nr:hypothetical protein [Planctomycetota bacterium]